MLVTAETGWRTTESHTHHGYEFGYVATGELELGIDGGTYELCQGDCFPLKSTLMHSFKNRGAARTQILWVNTQQAAGGPE